MTISLQSREEITSQLKISGATLDNWIRTSIPEALNNGLYDIAIISKFVSQHQKLNKRANKKSSTQREVPATLLGYLTNTDWIEDYLSHVVSQSAEDAGQDLIDVLQARLNCVPLNTPLEAIIPYQDTYAFGVAYQIALSTGDQSQAGAYYTPRWLVQKIVKELVSENKVMLEPSCGVGFYLIEYIRAYKEKFHKYPNGLIFGNDINPVASEISKLSILLDTNSEFKDFIITAKDGLSLDYRHKFDLVVTNPPYGIKNYYKDMKSTEIFGHFIHKSLTQYLKKDGILDFILPEAVLTVAKHQETRKLILENHNLKSSETLGKVFDGVFSDIVRIQVENNFNTDNNVAMIEASGDAVSVSQQSMKASGGLIVKMTVDDLKFVQDCYAEPHVLLKDEIFAMGIVTGNNAEMVSSEKKDGWLPVITGKDIKNGRIDYSNLKWISGDFERFQQKPSMDLFLKKKIVYKFISKDVDCALDETGALLLNSANFIVLRDGGVLKELGEQYVCGILNSDRMRRLYRLKFGGVIKVLKGSLGELPIWI